MKLVLAVIAEFFLFLLLDVAGGVFYHPFHIETKLTSTQFASRTFFWDGIVFVLLAWMLLLLFGLARKKFAAWAPYITLALALAALTGYFLKVGFRTHNW